MKAEDLVDFANRLDLIEKEIGLLEEEVADREQKLFEIKQVLASWQAKKIQVLTDCEKLAKKALVSLNSNATDDAALIKLLWQPIETLGLLPATGDMLEAANIHFIGQVVIQSKQEMLNILQGDQAALNQLTGQLEMAGLSLGMEVPENWQGVTFKADDSDTDPDEAKLIHNLQTPINDLNLPTDIRAMFRKNDILLLGDIVERGSSLNLNEKTRRVIVDTLEFYDLCFNMKLPKGWHESKISK